MITKEITQAKLALTKKAKAKGLYENFGDKEIRKLRDKYGDTEEVRAFADWCENFDLSQINSITPSRLKIK